MRVLVLTNLYPNPFQPTRGTYNRHGLRALAAEHDVRVIAPIAWTDELRARRSGAPPLPAGRRLVHDGILVDHPRSYHLPKVGRGWYGRWYLNSVSRAFNRAVDEFRPDVVFAAWAYPDGWAAVRLARRRSLPVVVKCLGSDVLLLDQHPGRRRPTVEAVCAADGVLAVSEHLARRLRSMGVESDNIRVVVDGIDGGVFHPGERADARRRMGLKDGSPLLLFVGNLLPVKGVDVLLEACRLLRDGGVDHRLVLVGGGPQRGELERKAESLVLGRSVHFQGVVRQEQLPDWYRAADLFVLPSRSEGIPNVLLEASACDVPWVASDVGGIPEIAGMGRSRLVPPESPGELAAAICAMLQAPPPPAPSAPRSWKENARELADFLGEVRASTRKREVAPSMDL